MIKLTQSYAHGACTEPLIGQTVGAAFSEAARRWHDRPALIVRHQNIRWTYEKLKHRVDAFAAGLIALGLASGDRIGIWSPNNAEWAVAQFATARAGLILVNINPAYRTSELEYALNKVGCTALITADRFRTSDYLGMMCELAPELQNCPVGALRSSRLPSLKTVISIGDAVTPGCVRFDDVPGLATDLDCVALEKISQELQMDDPVNVQFTSGTTGAPKGATLTHHNILNNGFFTGEMLRLTEQDAVCIPVPLYHCFGMTMGNLCCVTHGAAMVYPSEGFDARAVLEAVESERCTALYGVPSMFIAELGHPEFARFDLASLRTGIMAGAPCPIEVMRRCIRDMNMREVAICYGMTETSPVSTQTTCDDTVERRVTTVGRVHPHVEIKIVDASGRVAPPGAPGEFCTRGYSVMRGYWNDPERTSEAIDAAGWMHTGDLATMDEDGYVNIVGRIKDMVIRGGENIYPREIEEFLFRHPAIEAVQVVGVPDNKYGEELCAWVKLKSGEMACEDEIRAFCQRQIAHYKVPRYIKFVERFPMTVTGKVQKFAIREHMIRELDLTVERTA